MDALLLVLVIMSSVSAPNQGCELIICEGHKQTIDCPAGQVVDLQEAFYGREDKITCSDTSLSVKDTGCSSTEAPDRYTEMCNKKTSCTVRASNTGITDPCPNIYKYARIRYTCVSAISEKFTQATDYFRSNTELNWSQANDYCSLNNGSLILLNTENDWTNFTSAVSSLSHWCMAYHWTALQFDSQCGCEHDKNWIYDGWAKWYYNEPNACPQHACVVANIDGMRTRSCDDQYAVLCKKDVSTTTQTTNASPVSAHIYTTTSTQATAVVTSDAKTSAQSTLSALLTTGVPKMFTDDVSTSYNNTVVVDDSCEECCVKPNKSSQHSDEELMDILRDLKSQLAVNKKTLSTYRRKLVSVYDSRPSSVAMGGVAVVILVAFVSIIVVPDKVKLARYQNKRQKRQTS